MTEPVDVAVNESFLQGRLIWLQSIYERLVLHKPRRALLFLLVVFCSLAYQIRYFRLDASADSLVLESDEDLRQFREMTQRYGTDEFLLLTFTPNGELFSSGALETLKRLRNELSRLEHVSSVVTILDVPLFQNPPVPFSEIKGNIKTLESPDVDLRLAREELRESPIYRELLISANMASTALQINLRTDPELNELVRRRTELRNQENDGALNSDQRRELNSVEAAYQAKKELHNKERHEDILAVRRIVNRYRDAGSLFLGGVPMVADDMVTFVRNDLKVFGFGMICFLIGMLGIIFRQLRWVLLPMACCACSAIVAMGLVGAFGWQVTVISSNFVSLQLVLTMAITIHLVVRYNELLLASPEASQRDLVMGTVCSMMKPCLYTSLTTMAGFGSLLVCDILPVINFGWMMTMGLVVSLAVTFLLFPACLMVLGKPAKARNREFGRSMTGLFARLTEHHPLAIYAGASTILLITVLGILRLEVENSFIDYFRKSTEIYQGMKFIDDNLGGTTPLDVLLRFDEPVETETPPPPAPASPKGSASDEFAEFEDEFENAADSETYWFTPEKIQIISEVHRRLEAREATGKVLSVYTLIEAARQLKGGGDIDTFELALLLKALPERFKSVLLDPYVSFEHNEARINLRIRDSLPDLRRDAFLKSIKTELHDELGLSQKQACLSGVMVLYNNMLQSLFSSQISTIGLTVLALIGMFLVLFRSLRVSLIAIFPNLLACGAVLGVMGLLSIPLDMMTITIVAISIGIAVDNTIHYLHRFRHEFSIDRCYLATMYRCHGSIGNAMYYTSITIIVGFAILVFSNFIPSVLFGLLTGLAMVIALMAALALLPRLVLFLKPFGAEKLSE